MACVMLTDPNRTLGKILPSEEIAAWMKAAETSDSGGMRITLEDKLRVGGACVVTEGGDGKPQIVIGVSFAFPELEESFRRLKKAGASRGEFVPHEVSRDELETRLRRQFRL